MFYDCAGWQAVRTLFYVYGYGLDLLLYAAFYHLSPFLFLWLGRQFLDDVVWVFPSESDVSGTRLARISCGQRER